VRRATLEWVEARADLAEFERQLRIWELEQRLYLTPSSSFHHDELFLPGLAVPDMWWAANRRRSVLEARCLSASRRQAVPWCALASLVPIALWLALLFFFATTTVWPAGYPAPAGWTAAIWVALPMVLAVGAIWGYGMSSHRAIKALTPSPPMRPLGPVQPAEPCDTTRRAPSPFIVVVLVGLLLVSAIGLGALVSDAISTGPGASADRAAQSDLVNSAVTLKSLFATDGQFHSAASEVSELQRYEPELNFTVNPVTSANPAHQIEVIMSPDQLVVLLVAESQTGRCWDLEENEEATITAVPANWTTAQGISYGGTLASAGPQGSCSALFPDLLPGTFTGWDEGGFPS